MSDIRQFMEQFFQGLTEKKLEAAIESYAHDDRLFVFLEGPRSKTIGWDRVRAGWEGYLSSAITLNRITLGDDVQIRDYGQTGWLAASVHLTLTIGDGPPQTLETRGTWLLERHASQWRIVHEHVSLPHPDPYGIGDWGQNAPK